ncbi:TolC family protein [Mangrovimonas sp. AS39]|uniref:TolC family protein n=1 Tax=Mangrovimonas futianensis TaxID=2895523 RepID=UPI001E418D97|nr:TolC family protein [Mangrovimonas futianensis]MCF1191751.1 TolC family protein [Mangrovimonas futianensis]MCF1195361.1 TolC family protein [Mangrovimonas futianensis]
MRIKCFLIVLMVGIALPSYGQEPDPDVMTFKEFLAYVKQFHPLVKQANLVLDASEANLIKARGGFDPKIELDYSKKNFKDTDYYKLFNGSFKIPTWYGVNFKAAVDNNEGYYLNPENNTPDDGVYQVGVSVSLAKGLFINERMATLKQAKLYREQAKADLQMMVNDILYQASKTYFIWLKNYRNYQTYQSFLENAQIRFEGIKKGYEEGEYPAVDTLEARINLDSRKLNLEKARIGFVKSTLELSNYLWLENNIPVELEDHIIPDEETLNLIDQVLSLTDLDLESFQIENHPKLISLDYKFQNQEVDKRLKANALLPDITFDYNFLSEVPEEINSFNGRNYKSGLSLKLPLFLRKERGAFELAKLKLQDLEYEILSTNLTLKNKIEALKNEIESYGIQNEVAQELVTNYETLVQAEERKFFLGESSLFVVNSRESKLIETVLKAISVENDYLNSKANLFNVISTVPE